MSGDPIGRALRRRASEIYYIKVSRRYNISEMPPSGADSASPGDFSKILAERTLFQARQVEAVDVFDERDKSARTKIECGLALVERPGGCIPGRTARVQVLRHPAEAGGMAGAQLLELVFHRDRRRLCARHLAAHGFGLDREHERGLDLAGMNAVREFLVGEQTLGIAEPVPGGGDHEHAEADAQIARDDIDDRRIAAVRIDDDELLDARAVHALADLGPGADRAFCRKRQRARPAVPRSSAARARRPPDDWWDRQHRIAGAHARPRSAPAAAPAPAAAWRPTSRPS